MSVNVNAVDLKVLCEERARDIIAALLDTEFFPDWIQGGVGYQRYGDDTWFGSVSVGCLPDGDGAIEVSSQTDPDEFTRIHRFRTYFGGGESERVRKALLILALAIQMDNADRPQSREAILERSCTCPDTKCLVHGRR